MLISVIIPTYNRLSVLKRCLECLDRQSVSKDIYEVIVIDDGSTDGTEKSKDKIFENTALNGRYFYQKNKGPAKARNLGVKESKGDVLIIIGDDIWVDSDFILKHMEIHKKYSDPVAVIGKIAWSKELTVTPFMDALENGIQFSFNTLTNDNISFKNCYTSNVSISKEFILKNNVFFDESFPYAAYEDIEWGYRLMKSGMKFVYQPEAFASHYHPTNLEAYSKRMVLAGKAYAFLCRLHPDFDSKKLLKPGNRINFFIKFLKAKFRMFLLNRDCFPTVFKTKIRYVKWIKSILSYYEEKGFHEEFYKSNRK